MCNKPSFNTDWFFILVLNKPDVSFHQVRHGQFANSSVCSFNWISFYILTIIPTHCPLNIKTGSRKLLSYLYKWISLYVYSHLLTLTFKVASLCEAIPNIPRQREPLCALSIVNDLPIIIHLYPWTVTLCQTEISIRHLRKTFQLSSGSAIS